MNEYMNNKSAPLNICLYIPCIYTPSRDSDGVFFFPADKVKHT
jgi:hypothetical protein